MKSNREEYNSQWFGGINDELVALEDQKMSLNEDLNKLERQQTDVTVRAPQSGMILNLHSLYPGAVISANPQDLKLIFDVVSGTQLIHTRTFILLYNILLKFKYYSCIIKFFNQLLNL